MSTQYCQPIYHLPVLLFFCQVLTCLQPTCPPMFLDYRQPVYHLPIFLFLCISQLPTYLPPTCPPTSTDYLTPPTCLSSTCLIPLHLPTAYLSTTDLPAYVHWLPVHCRPAYRWSVLINLLNAKSGPVSHRPVYCPLVFLFLSFCQLTTCLLPTCLLPIYPPMFTEYLSTVDLSTADLSTCVHLYAVWSRTLIYCATIQQNCLGTTSTNITSDLREFLFISVA